MPSTVSKFLKGKKLSHQKKFFPSVSHFELLIFGILVKKFGSFTKTALDVSRIACRRKKIFELISFFSISLWLGVDDFQDFGEKCRKCHQSCILPVQTNILPKKGFGEKKSTLLDFREKIVRISVRNCWPDYQTFLLIVQKKSLRKQNLHKRVISNHFLTLGEKVSNFYPKSPSRAVRTAIYVSRGWIPGFFFSKYRLLQFSTTSSKIFWTVCDKFLAAFSFMHFAYPKGGFGTDFWLQSGLHNHGFQAIKIVGFF